MNDRINSNIGNKSETGTTIIDGEIRIPITFNYSPTEDRKKPSSVQVCGSFDKWQVRHPLTYDPLYAKWSVTLKIRKGMHQFKYIVDGEWLVSITDRVYKDPAGYTNNIISI